MDDDTREREQTWLRTVFLAGFDAGKRDTREHPGGYPDPWASGYGARSELEFQKWLQGMVPECKQ